MGYIIVKPDRDEDLYVIWSTFTDSPVFYGDRTETFAELGGDVRLGRWLTWWSWVAESTTPAARLRKADEHGSDARRYGWDKSEFFYQQAGMLARADLVKAVDLECAGRDDLVLELLTPFEDAPELLVEAKRRQAAMVDG
jgi:hypothetical protein